MRHLSTLSTAFFIVLAVNIYASAVDNTMLDYITKPLLMPLLLVLFWLNNKGNDKKERLFFSLGLVFSLGGDVFLMFHSATFFIAGLLSFLIAHLAYIFSFADRVKQSATANAKLLLYAIPFALYILAFLYFLYPYINGNPQAKPLLLPVVAYGCIIGTMSFMAFIRRRAVSPVGFVLVFVGSLLFISSDSALSTAIFVGRFPYSDFIIMSTYGVAQYLLTLGTLQK